MANDRIYLVCRNCKAQQMLYKYYPSGNGYAADSDKLTVFLNEHIVSCHPNGHNVDLEGNPGFDLVTESDTQEHDPVLPQVVTERDAVNKMR